MSYVGDVAALARKDLLLELRGRETVPAMVVFAVGALVVFRFALPGEQSEAAKGLLWVAILFTALLALTRAFAAERDQGLLDALVLAPCDRSAIWLAKAVATIAFLVLVEVFALAAFWLFFGGLGVAALAAVALADVGLCAAGVLLAAMAVGGRARELLLPVLFLPVALPVLVGGVGATVTDDPARYLGFLALYDAVFAILAWAGFEYVVTE
ncbi:MAG: heme exporter protein CcmB [Thermoleophilia bacterium]|nr:heme exporter protein CcmB [Thermoleophilia bacterium]